MAKRGQKTVEPDHVPPGSQWKTVSLSPKPSASTSGSFRSSAVRLAPWSLSVVNWPEAVSPPKSEVNGQKFSRTVGVICDFALSVNATAMPLSGRSLSSLTPLMSRPTTFLGWPLVPYRLQSIGPS